MKKGTRVVHFTTVDNLQKILQSGELLPKSFLSGLASSPFHWLFFLPRLSTQMGIFGLLELEAKKWRNDKQAWRYLEMVTKLCFWCKIRA